MDGRRRKIDDGIRLVKGGDQQRAGLASIVHRPSSIVYGPMPAQVTSLIGREREVAQASSLLARPDVRLLTITGPPGVGKTRLALEVAGSLAGDFADGV